MKDKPLSRISLALILTAALSIAIFGQQVPTQSAPNVDRLRQHVTYLASDALEGRRTGSAGANDAAHYIAGEFSRLGLQPAIQGSRAARTRGEAKSKYLQKFPYVGGVELGNDNKLSFAGSSNLATTNFQVGDDWMPLGISTNARLDNLPVAFAGFGITSSELKYDDYAGANAAGRIAIAFSGTPDGDNPHGQFGRYEDVRWKAIAARGAGAKALVVVARQENLKEDGLSRLQYNNNAGDAGLPIIVISRAAAAKLLSLSDTASLTSLEGNIRRVSLYRTSPPSGWTPEKESFLLPPPSYQLSLSTDILRREVAASNVIGILEGSDPTLKNETIVIGAHYDHLGHGGEGSLAPLEGEIHHGADDNASGVAGVLELARMFTAQRPRPRRTIVFIAFSGEEEGLLGSNYYVNHPIVPMANTVAMINMDMIGRMKNQKLIVGGVGTSLEWRKLVENANLGFTPYVLGTVPRSSTSAVRAVINSYDPKVGNNDKEPQFSLTLNEDGFGPSDHSSFYAKKVPVLFFWTGTHEDYHKPSDTADKINYADEARILGIVARVVRDIDINDKRPVFADAKSESTGRATGFRVYLGTIPNYADSSDGLLLDGVRDGSPAAKSGIKAGDRIVSLAGREVHNIYDYTYALGEMKAGQEYDVELMRGGERLKLKITPAGRK